MGTSDSLRKDKSPTEPKAKRSYEKSPLFTATHAARYQRQIMIRDLEDQTDRTLLCFVCGDEAEIERNDVIGFVDLLHNVHAGESIDLMLHTGGGDIDAAEKLIRLVQKKVGGEGSIRIVIPDYAKSAGTLMALGANWLMMSDSSELGAIDPQHVLRDKNGNESCRSVLVYLAAYREHLEALQANPDDPVAQLLFDKFEPAQVAYFKSIAQRARSMADKLLHPRLPNYTKITSDLLNVSKWHSHNQMITAEDAVDIGLNVEILAADDPIWQKFWSLYCHLRLSIQAGQKVFESNYVHLAI